MLNPLTLTVAIWAESQSARMSKITKDSLPCLTQDALQLYPYGNIGR